MHDVSLSPAPAGLPVDADARRRLLYERMVLIRTVEESLLQLFAEGLLRGTVHTCLGQEAIAAGVVLALDRQRDVICTNHRGHGHYLAYCDDVAGLIAEIMGKPAGVCGGIGGSQHVQRDNFYANGILGGMVPVATGMALAEKHRGSGAVVTVFLGDGAMAEGSVYEAFNMASLWDLPVLFVVEHNGVAQSTPWHLEHAGALERRAEPFGITGTDLDGNDAEAVLATASRVTAEIRLTSRPQLLFLRTYRLGPHSKGDDLRDPAEIAAHVAEQPILRLRRSLPDDWCTRIEQLAADRVAAIIADLKQRPDTP